MQRSKYLLSSLFLCIAMILGTASAWADDVVSFVGKSRGTLADGVFTTAKNAGNGYALALADLSDIENIGKAETVTLTFDTKILLGSRFLVGIGDKAVRGETANGSSKSTYNTDGLVMHFGTKDGTSYRVNSGTNNTAAFGVKAHMVFVLDRVNKTYSYTLTNAETEATLFSALNVATEVTDATVIEAYSWLGNTTIELSDVTVALTLPQGAGTKTVNANIDFSNPIEGSYSIAGTVGAMTWTQQWTYAPEVVDGILHFGNFDGGKVELQENNIRNKDLVTISFEMAFGKLSNKHVGFQLTDTEGNDLLTQWFDAYNGDFDDANPLNLDWDNMYRGSNTPIQERCVYFTIEIDYAAKTITTKTRCFKSGTGKAVTEATATAEWTKTEKIGNFVLLGNINNADRYSTFDNLLITTTTGDYSAATANYTVRYVCNGQDVKESATYSGDVDAEALLSSSDKENFFGNEEQTTRYIYVSDDAEGKTIASDGSTVITVTFREAEQWTYSVTSSYDNTALPFAATGSVWEDLGAFTVRYPRFQLSGTQLVERQPNSNNLTQNYTATQNAFAADLAYTAVEGKNNVCLLSEAEDLQTTLGKNGTSFADRVSGGQIIYGASGDLLALPAGKYIFTLGAIGGDNGSHQVSYVLYKEATPAEGEHSEANKIGEGTVTGNFLTLITSSEFTLTEETVISFTCSDPSSSRGIDLVYVQKTSEPTVEPEYPVDVTAKVSTADWLSDQGSVGNYTKDVVQKEHYLANTTTVQGDVLYQTVQGLSNGTYTVELYANASYTNGRGFASEALNGELGRVVVYAGDVEKTIPVVHQTAVAENNIVTLENVIVSDGTLKMGIRKLTAGSNWHTIQIKSLVQQSADTQADAAAQDEYWKGIAQTVAAYEAYKNVAGQEKTAIAAAQTKAAAQAAIPPFYAAKPSYDALVEIIAEGVALNADMSMYQALLNNGQTTADLAAAAVEDAKPVVEQARHAAKLAENTAAVDGASRENPVETSFVVNGTFDQAGVIAPWKSTTGAQNQTTANNQQGAFGVTNSFFYENWNPGSFTGKMYQVIEDIPNGLYKLDIAAFVNNLDANAQYVYANADQTPLTAGEPTAYTVETIVSNNTIEIGLEQTAAVANWMGIDNAKLTYYGPLSMDDLIAAYTEARQAAEAIDQTKPMNAIVKRTLLAAIARQVDQSSIDELSEATTALLEATAAADASIAAYATAAANLAANKAELEGTNVYREEVYKAKFTDVEEALANGTMTNEQASAIQPVRTDWHAENYIDDVLMSAWDANVMDWTTYHVNTWSNEGDNDGSNFTVPFIEYWTGDGESLGEKVITATMSNLERGLYEVTALVRVRVKNNVNDAAAGISLQVNDGEAVSVCTGTPVANTRFSLKEFAAKGIVGEDGELKIKFNVAADNNISWLAFKNVMFEKQFVPGDITGTGEVTISDAVPVVDFVLGLEEPTDEQLAAADVNNDNEITISDVVGIVSISLGRWDGVWTEAARTATAAAGMLAANSSSLSLQSDMPFVGFQMDVTLAEGAVLNGATLLAGSNHMVRYNRISANTWRIVALSFDNEQLANGQLLSLDIAGNQQFTVVSNEFTTADMQARTLAVGVTTGIDAIAAGQFNGQTYTLGGAKTAKTVKGLNIVVGADGTASKVLVK